MEETIELREVINILIKGKWIISICVAICLVISVIFTWFVTEESYTSTATVQVVNTNLKNPEESNVMSNFMAVEFTPTVYMQRLTKEAATIGAVSASNTPNTDLIVLTSSANSAQKAQQQLQQVMDATVKDLETSIDETLQNTNKKYLKEAEELSAEIEQLMQQYNKIVTTNDLPNILLLQTILSEGITLNVSDSQLSDSSNLTGTVQNELLSLKAQIETKSEEYRKNLTNYQSVKTGLGSMQIEQYVRTIVEPNLASAPSSPNKKMNVVIGLILGLMIGISLVFFRSYWKATAK